MEILHFEGSSRAPLKHRKGFRVILGITVMGLFGALGSTLAANITINQGPVEFGQGLAAAAACDGSITVSPRASFTNQSDTAGVFYLKSLDFGGLNYTACDDKELVISTYDSNVATANYLGHVNGDTSDSITTVVVYIGADSAAVTSPASASSYVDFGSSVGVADDSDTFTVTFKYPLTQAGNVYKVTVESRDKSS